LLRCEKYCCAAGRRKREIIVTQVCVLALALEGSFADIFVRLNPTQTP
jgi:hypothetical protein